MKNIYNEFVDSIKKDKVFVSINTIIITWLLIPDLRNGLMVWIKSEFGIQGEIATAVSLISLLLVLKYTFFIRDKSIRKGLKTNLTTEDLLEKYKGLVVSISLIREPKQDIFNKINAVKDVHDRDKMELVYKTIGIGQTFRAIKHHLGELRDCWLLCTGDVEESKELVEHFINKFSKNTVRIHPIEINDPYKVEETFKKINRIYSEEIKSYDLIENEVIADLTGGTAIMSCAMIFSCLSPDRDMEYVLQKEDRKLIKINEDVSNIVFKR